MKSLYELSVTKKIALSGIILALVVVLNKILAINYISFIPFVRVSFGSIALIVFSSIGLGPIYGLVIGAGADVLGYFLFDASSFGFFPQVTAIYALLGVLPFFFYQLLSLVKNKRTMQWIEYGTFALIFVGVTTFFIFNNKLTLYSKTYNFAYWQRILIPSIALMLFAVIIVVNKLISKSIKYNGRLTLEQVSFIIFLSEVSVMLLFGSLMKAWAFGFGMFFPILFSQAVIMFFDVAFNTYLLFVILKIADQIMVK